MKRFLLFAGLSLAFTTPLVAQQHRHHYRHGGGNRGGYRTEHSPVEIGIAYTRGWGRQDLSLTPDVPIDNLDSPQRVDALNTLQRFGQQNPDAFRGVATTNWGFKLYGHATLGSFLFWGTGVRYYKQTWVFNEMPSIESNGQRYSPEMTGSFIQFPFEGGLYFWLDKHQHVGLRFFGGVNLNLMMASETTLETVRSQVQAFPTEANNLPNLRDPRMGWHAGIGLEMYRLLFQFYHSDSFDDIATEQGRRNMGLQGFSYYSWNVSLGFLIVD